jgi:hypothetical protein
MRGFLIDAGGGIGAKGAEHRMRFAAIGVP